MRTGQSGASGAARSPQTAGKPAQAPSQPLHGLRVLDFTHVLAGPFCTRLLADLGAEVLRVESSKHPDAPWKSVIDPATGRDVSYLVVNRNKQSVAIDLKTDQGRELATRLACVADVLVENFSAGVMHRLGLDYDRLSSRNPALIYVSMSGYGHEGPRRDWTSMNTNLQAYSGLMTVTGKDGDPPTAISNSWMDYIGGLHACFAIIHAASQMRETEKGSRIDLSQFECGVAAVGPLLLAAVADGRLPSRVGNRSTSAAPQGCYPCAGWDEWCAISIQDDSQWHALVQVMGNSALGHDDRFATVAGRARYHDELDSYIAAWTRSLASTDVEGRLRACGVPAARMRRINDLLDAPDGSGVFQRPNVASDSAVLMTTLPFRISPSSLAALSPAPRLGENTDSALRAWLALAPDEVNRFREDEVLI